MLREFLPSAFVAPASRRQFYPLGTMSGCRREAATMAQLEWACHPSYAASTE